MSQTGISCCTRHLDWDRAYQDDYRLHQEFDQLLVRATARRLWFLHIKQGEFGENRQEEPVHRALLAQRGCRREQEYTVNGTLISASRCPFSAGC